MTLEEFQSLDIKEGDKVMLSYHTPISIEYVQTMIKVEEIIINDDDFIILTTRRKFLGKTLSNIKQIDSI
jgi:hypothetical protein